MECLNGGFGGEEIKLGQKLFCLEFNFDLFFEYSQLLANFYLIRQNLVKFSYFYF